MVILAGLAYMDGLLLAFRYTKSVGNNCAESAER